MKKKKQKVVNIIFLLDKTGSMCDKVKDVIGGFNRFIADQKNAQKETGIPINFWFTLFNSIGIEKRYEGVDINDVEELSDENYIVCGMTPLYDAIGKTLTDMADINEALLVIFTDGEENSSSEYNSHSIKSMIASKEQSGFKFLYMGIDLKDFQQQSTSAGIFSSVNTNSNDIQGSYMSMTSMARGYSKLVMSGSSADFDTVNAFNSPK